ncbi:kinase-like protein [Trichodelitschia bisporula]|uniref:non-specific serine/threonine protein kinase n=1 Tax=Trichodelitschia bisporula TaxID=703511 RepID=A0A6G1I826_9PEZI|nr:kinase-like protein [Trichodelitschia bisporula]
MADSEKYEVLEKIGHGSFGVIHKVRRKSDGLILCRKEISYTRMSPKEREQLQAELSILKELRHPNIVRYFERDHLKTTQDLHLYMEYCGNGDLSRVIKKLKLHNQYADEEFVWSIFAQLVSALYRCHYGEAPPEVGRNVMSTGNNGRALKSKQMQYMILHRDLKPENVFLDDENSVKLGDFGLSKILQSHDFASTYVGTPYYMSPEICAAERYSLYSDIWSLGCLMYELCAKEPPFNARTHIELFHKIKTGRVAPIPPVYSPELQRVITSCLQVNPNNRPDTAHLLNLPVVKLMRKEQEVVHLGKQLKKEKELAERMQKEAADRIARLDAERDAMRAELDATVRREWEVKARLEIDKQVLKETDHLREIFATEVSQKVAEQLKLVSAQQAIAAAEQPRSSTPSLEAGALQNSASSEDSVPSLTVSAADSSELPSGTDISSLSLESPTLSKVKPMKRSARTPFTRAQTMFVNNVPSPMDVHMADPSPMSIAGLSLSPRRTGAGQTGPKMKGNLFGEDRWQATNASALNSPHISDTEHDGHLSDDDDIVTLPSPTRGLFKSKRPSLGRAKTTLPANAKRMASGGNIFAQAAVNAGANVKRAVSTVPVVATSPTRVRAGSPVRGRTLVIGAAKVNEAGSPVRKGTKEPALKSKKDEGMIKTAFRNQLQGRTLVELSHARGGDKDVPNATIRVAARMADKEVPVWDPEKDDMPSPFLVKTRIIKMGAR